MPPWSSDRHHDPKPGPWGESGEENAGPQLPIKRIPGGYGRGAPGVLGETEDTEMWGWEVGHGHRAIDD